MRYEPIVSWQGFQSSTRPFKQHVGLLFLIFRTISSTDFAKAVLFVEMQRDRVSLKRLYPDRCCIFFLPVRADASRCPDARIGVEDVEDRAGSRTCRRMR